MCVEITSSQQAKAPYRRYTCDPLSLMTEASEEVLMPDGCGHLDTVRTATPSAKDCEECLPLGQEWVHLRICRLCGHVGCCDQSPGKHATAHFHASGHPIIEGYDLPEGWGWCFDETFVDLPDQTPQVRPIPQYI